MKNPSFREACMVGLLVGRHHRRRPKSKNPRRRCRQGLGVRTIQALVGAVLQDNDDYDASLLNSITSHAGHAITVDFTPQGNHTERVQLPGRAANVGWPCHKAPRSSGRTQYLSKACTNYSAFRRPFISMYAVWTSGL